VAASDCSRIVPVSRAIALPKSMVDSKTGDRVTCKLAVYDPIAAG